MSIPNKPDAPYTETHAEVSHSPSKLRTLSTEGSRWDKTRASLLRPTAQFSMRTMFVLMTVSGFIAFAAKLAGGQTVIDIGAWLLALMLVLGFLATLEHFLHTPIVFVCGVASTCAFAVLSSVSISLNESVRRYESILDREVHDASASARTWEHIRPEHFFGPLLGWTIGFGFFAMLGMLVGGLILLRQKVRKRFCVPKSTPSSPNFTSLSNSSTASSPSDSPNAPSPSDNTP